MNRNGLMMGMLLVLFVVAICKAETNTARVLILSPAQYFSTANIATNLRSQLIADGRYTTVAVAYKDTCLTNYSYYLNGYYYQGSSEGLLGYYYYPEFRDASLNLIRTGQWTHVVMIDKPCFYACAVEFHFEAVDHLAKVIREAGAKPVLMMP